MGSNWRRLTLVDWSNLAVESRDVPMHIGGIAILDGAGLQQTAGTLDAPALLSRLDRRLARVPELRQRLWYPGLFRGGPVWVDDQDFSIGRHVHVGALPAGADESDLLETAARLMEPLLDRTHPLWELWFLTGLAGSRVAMLFKLHHAVADGLAAVALISTLFDFEPGAPEPPSAPRLPQPWPSDSELFADVWRRRSAWLRTVLGHPIRSLRGLCSVVVDALDAVRGPRAPHTSFNQPVRAGRQNRVLNLELDTVRAVAHGHGGKINDAVLAIVASAMRDLLLSRGEPVESVSLQVSVPVGQRAASDPRELGNAAGMMRLPLAIGDADPGRLLDLAVAATREAKRTMHTNRAAGLIASLGILGLAQPFIARQHLVNLFVSNVPGPSRPIYVLGSRVLDAFPFTVLAGNVPVSFAAFSYVGRLNLVTQVDPAAVPDVDLIARGMARAWAQLRAAWLRANVA
jgi:diacylglycerol O-acyltransferase / wax synthase